MARLAIPERTPQIPLGLEPVALPSSEAALRAAYKRLGFSRRYTFEQAMQDRAFSICIRNFAEATALRINRRRRRRIAP
jgi:hypothetical protein